MKCIEITIKIQEIKTKKAEFDILVKTDIPKALMLKKEIESSIQKLKEIFPAFFTIEGKRFPIFKLEIGGKTPKELVNELLDNNFKISDLAKDMLHSSDFVTSPTVEQINLVRLKVSDLGFPGGADMGRIYSKAKNLGLELCPAEVGPYQRLQDTDQLVGEDYRIAMRQISVRDGLSVFRLGRGVDSLWLSHHVSVPLLSWPASYKFVFRVPTKNNKGEA